MSDSIKLSPKHGVNATVPVCFWCGQDKNEIAFLGKIGKSKAEDPEAPMHMILDYEPCDMCKELFSRGIHVFGVTEKQPDDKRPPITTAGGGTPMYPTGTFFVGTRDWIKRLLSDNPETLDEVLDKGTLALSDDMVVSIIEEFKKYEEEIKNEDN